MFAGMRAFAQGLANSMMETPIIVSNRTAPAKDPSNPNGDDLVSFEEPSFTVLGWFVSSLSKSVTSTGGMDVVVEQDTVRVPVGTDIRSGARVTIRGQDWTALDTSDDDSVTSGLDVAQLKNHFVKGAMSGANAAAEKALPRIQKHAPVRKLFRGGSTRIVHGYRVPRQQAFKVPTTAGKVTSVRNRETAAEGSVSDIQFAHPNAERPSFRIRRAGQTFEVSGDFRRLAEPGRLAAVHTTSVLRSRGRVISVREGRVSGDKLVDPSGRRLLTSRGRFEVKAGRANFRSPEDGRERVGGRLRGEIYIEPATFDGSEVWAYIVSPTKDPETGYPYNRAQEFGTVHNRAHPFMRPGLRESAKDLSREVGRHVKAGSQK